MKTWEKRNAGPEAVGRVRAAMERTNGTTAGIAFAAGVSVSAVRAALVQLGAIEVARIATPNRRGRRAFMWSLP